MPPAYPPTLSMPDLPKQPDPEGTQIAPTPQSTAYHGHTPGASTYGHAGMPTTNPPIRTSHLFERIQFKQATQNNGKRRASQQFFHLLVECHALTEPEPGKEQWVKVSQRVSEKVVVRGRSPSHYQEGANGQGGRNTGGSSGSSGYSHGPNVSYGASTSSGFRPGNSQFDIRPVPGQLPSQFGGNSLPGFPGSPNGSSIDSVEGGASDEDQHDVFQVHDGDRKYSTLSNSHDVPEYSYDPRPLQYLPQITTPDRRESGLTRTLPDPRGLLAAGIEHPHAHQGPHWPTTMADDGFEGFPTSRGYYPDFRNGAASFT
jgi:meiosis-specific transcription factor NDT80